MSEATRFEELFAAPLRNGVSYAAKLRGHGIPMVNMKEIFAYDRIADQDCELVPLTAAERESGLLEAGDLLFARQSLTYEGAGKCVFVLDSDHERTWESHLIRVRLDTTKASAGYYYYYFRSPQGRRSIESIIQQVAAAGIRGSDLRRLSVPRPAVNEQRAIAELLGALDDKIAANANLVSLLSEHIDASFVSIVGRWRERIPLGELVSVTKGVSYRSADLVPSATALVTLKSIQRDGNYSTRGLKSFAGAFKDIQRIRGGEIVVAQTDLTQAADVVGRAVRVPASSNFDTLVASLDIAIVRPKPVVEQHVVLGVLRDRRFIEHCKSRTTGTTVLHLAKDAIESFSAPEVSIEVQRRYAAVVAPMHDMRDALEREGEALASMRDELLPQLMSGKIRVMHAEQTVGDVV